MRVNGVPTAMVAAGRRFGDDRPLIHALRVVDALRAAICGNHVVVHEPHRPERADRRELRPVRGDGPDEVTILWPIRWEHNLERELLAAPAGGLEDRRLPAIGPAGLNVVVGSDGHTQPLLEIAIQIAEPHRVGAVGVLFPALVHRLQALPDGVLRGGRRLRSRVADAEHQEPCERVDRRPGTVPHGCTSISPLMRLRYRSPATRQRPSRGGVGAPRQF